MTELEARTALDDAIHAYAATAAPDGAVGAWALVFERSALVSGEDEPLRFATSSVVSPGTSAPAALGLLIVAARRMEDAAAGGMEE